MSELFSRRVTHLAYVLAKVTGEDMETAVVSALEERLARIGPQAVGTDDDQIDVLFERLGRMPIRDARSLNEIIGYEPNGLPK